ncbi:hypothetical protein [Rhizobium sp.]
MAKVKLTTLIGDNFEVWDAYSGDIRPQYIKAKESVYLDYNFSSVVFHGTGMKGSGLHMNKGEVTSIDFDNYQGNHFLTVSGLELKAKQISNILLDKGVEALMTFILKGNDTIKGAATDDILKGGAGNDKIFGGAGSDFIFGGAGKDTLTGGADTDYFRLEAGGGKDVVTDFAGGMGDGHDYVHVGYQVEYDIIDNKKGAIVRLAGGDQIQLLGIDVADVMVFQEYVPPGGF